MRKRSCQKFHILSNSNWVAPKHSCKRVLRALGEYLYKARVLTQSKAAVDSLSKNVTHIAEYWLVPEKDPSRAYPSMICISKTCLFPNLTK